MNMKKIAFVAFAAALGLAAQGEMLYWKVTGVKSSSDKALTGDSQYLAYIFADTNSGPTTGSNAANMFTTSKNPITSIDTVKERLANSKDISDLAYYNSKGVRSYDKTKGRLNSYDGTTKTASYDAQVGWIGVGGTVNLFAVILDSTTFETAENYMIAQTTAGTEVLTIETTSNAESTNMKSVYFEWGSQEKNTWYKIGTAIPEPTSGLLLVLGMATLALKRRHI